MTPTFHVNPESASHEVRYRSLGDFTPVQADDIRESHFDHLAWPVREAVSIEECIGAAGGTSASGAPGGSRVVLAEPRTRVGVRGEDRPCVEAEHNRFLPGVPFEMSASVRDRATCCTRPKEHMVIQVGNKVLETPSFSERDVAAMKRCLISNVHALAAELDPLPFGTTGPDRWGHPRRSVESRSGVDQPSVTDPRSIRCRGQMVQHGAKSYKSFDVQRGV